MDINKHKLDRAKVEDGVWRDIGYGDVRVKYRSPQSKKFQEIKKRKEAPFRSAMRKGKMTPEKTGRIIFESIVEGGILDWENVSDGDKEIPFSIEHGYFYIDPDGDYIDFSEAVINGFFDSSEDYYLEKAEERKNSLNVLNGKSG